MLQYIYKITLKPAYHDSSLWSEEEHSLVREHTQYLDKAFIENRLILAGSTQNAFIDRFGIVIFWATSEKSARDFMNDDPVVKFGMMDAELFPYAVYKCSLLEHEGSSESIEN